MRLLVVTYSSNLNGGANRSLLMVLEYLIKMYQYNIHVIVPGKGVLCDALDELGISWESHHYNAIGMINMTTFKGVGRYFKHKINTYRNDYEARRRFENLRKENFDLVYLNNNGAAYGANLAKYLGLPFVWHFRGEIYKESHYLPEIASMICKCSRIIAVSYDMKALYLRNPVLAKKKIDVIHNSIMLTDCKSSMQTRETGFHIVQCGRIAVEKCQMDAIKAVDILVRQYKDIYLHIVGSGYGGDGNTYEQILKKYVNEHDLKDNVIFEGYRNDMSEFRRHMNCELICSLREPFGRVTLEGMRSGLTVIGANTGGTVEIIRDGQTGLLYRQGDVEDLARKILKIYSNPDKGKELAQNGLEYARTHFLPEDTVSRLNEIFIEVMSRNHAE